MRLTLCFDVNQQRVTEGDLRWMMRYQREFASAIASIAYLQFAVPQDRLLAGFLAAGEVVEGFQPFEPSAERTEWYGPRPRMPILLNAANRLQTARDICWMADRDGWMWARWPCKVHMALFQANSRTQCFRTGPVTVVTSMSLPPGVNELCHAMMRNIIDGIWFRGTEPEFFDVYEPQDPLTQRVRAGIDFRFTSGVVRGAIERSVAFEVSRLDRVTGPQDPDFCYDHAVLDAEMFVRMCGADCDLDNEVSESDHDIGIQQW